MTVGCLCWTSLSQDFHHLRLPQHPSSLWQPHPSLSPTLIKMGRTKASISRKQSVDDADTVEVKRENSVDAALAHELGSANFTKLKRDGSASASRSPSINSPHLKTSRSASTSSLHKIEVEPKSESRNGHVSPVKPEPVKAKMARSASSKGPPPRIAPLFDHLPDVTGQATSAFQVIHSSTYQNKYLGYTESALECDCSEEWGQYPILTSSQTILTTL